MESALATLGKSLYGMFTCMISLDSLATMALSTRPFQARNSACHMILSHKV